MQCTQTLTALMREEPRLLRGRISRFRFSRLQRPSKNDPGFHFNWPSVSRMRLEFPLLEHIRDGFRLIGKCAQEVDMFYFAFLVDNDSHRNRIESMLGENRIHSRNQITTVGIILNADWYIAAAGSSRGIGFRGQLHLIQIEHQTLQ